MYHTMDPAYSALYRMNPLANNTLATAELNQRGLFPTGNQRADVSGPYPANIRMQRKDTPECNRRVGTCGGCGGGGCGGGRSDDIYGPGQACNACCPGFKQTSWDELVGRRCCSACTTPAAEPRMADGGLGAMSSFDVQRYEARNGYGCSGCAAGWGESANCPQGPSNCFARDDKRCCTPMSAIVERSGCSRSALSGAPRAVPFPMFNFNNDDAGMFGGYTGFTGDYAMPARPAAAPAATAAAATTAAAGNGTKKMSPAVAMAAQQPAMQPSNRVEPIVPQSPLVKAKDASDAAARVEADAINLTRCQKALDEARAIAARATQMADSLRAAAGKAAANGQLGVAAEKQAQSDKLVTAQRQSEQMANYAQNAAAEATKAANNGDSKGVVDAANASMQAASGAIEKVATALGATGTAGGTAQQASGFMWS